MSADLSHWSGCWTYKTFLIGQNVYYYWLLLYSAFLSSCADLLHAHRMWFWVIDYPFTALFLYLPKWCTETESAIRLLHVWCYVKLFTPCNHTPFYNVTLFSLLSHMCEVHVCLLFSCDLPPALWQGVSKEIVGVMWECRPLERRVLLF